MLTLSAATTLLSVYCMLAVNAVPAPQSALSDSTSAVLPPLLQGRSLTYSCLSHGLVFSDPNSDNKYAQINFIPGFEQGTAKTKCNAAFPSICNNACTVTSKLSAGFNCYLHGNIVKDDNNKPVVVNIWWGFEQKDVSWACNEWVSKCNKQCEGVV
jgi:hypothetical protein